MRMQSCPVAAKFLSNNLPTVGSKPRIVDTFRGLFLYLLGGFLNQLCLELFTGDEYIRREIFFSLARYLDMQVKGGIYGSCDDRAARERF